VKTKLLVPVLLLLCYFADAGDSTAVKSFHRFYVGASFTGNCSYRYLRLVNANGDFWSNYGKEVMADQNSNEHPMFGYKAGVRFGVNIFRWFGVETGLDYNLHRWYSKELLSWYCRDCFWKVNYDYHYLDIPLALNFFIGKKKVRGIIQAGVNFDCLYKRVSRGQLIIGDRVAQTQEPGDTFSSKSFHRFNISPFLGIGIDWRLTKFLYLRIMPMAQMQSIKNLDFQITEYLWSAGVNTTLLFGFRRKKQSPNSPR
jgi:hypothetical protein